MLENTVARAGRKKLRQIIINQVFIKREEKRNEKGGLFNVFILD